MSISKFGAVAFAPNIGTKILPSILIKSPSHRNIIPRGGTATQLHMVDSSAVLQNFSSAASAYFISLRVPAGLIAAATLSALFVFSKDVFDINSKSKIEQSLLRIYVSSMIPAWLLSINTIVFSTAATVTILHGDFNPMAQTGYQLLKREFEFEYVSARFSFLCSLLLFVVGVTSRAVLSFGLYKDDKKHAGRAYILLMVSMVTHLACHINETLYSFANLFTMGIHLNKMILKRAFIDRNKPLQFVSVILAVLAYFSYSRHFVNVLKAKPSEVSEPNDTNRE